MGLTVRQAALLVTAVHVLGLGGLLAVGLLEAPTPPRVIQVSLQPPFSPPPVADRRPSASATAPAPAPKKNAAPWASPPPATTPATTPTPTPPAPATPVTPPLTASPSPASANNAADDRQPTVDASFRGNPLPVYPPMSRRLGEQGVVVLRVLIDANGRAVDLQVQRSSGSARLDQAALEAIREWRFIPARRGGKPVPEWYEWRWEFRLNG
jgi:protein TonB